LLDFEEEIGYRLVWGSWVCFWVCE